MKVIIAAGLALLAATSYAKEPAAVPSAYAQARDLVLRPTDISLLYTVRLNGGTDCTVRFTKVDAELLYNAADMSRTRLTAHVDPSAVEIVTIPEGRDRAKSIADMLGSVFLNVASFPSLQLESTAIAGTGDKAARLSATLTMLGAKKPLTLNVKLNGYEEVSPGRHAIRFTADGTLYRSQFGMTGGPTWSDDVRISINAAFIPK